MSGVLQQIMPNLVEIVGTLVGAAVVWLAAAAKKKIDASIRQALVRDVLRTTVDAAALAVNSLEQQLVAKTKAAYADGVLTDEEYRQILTEAKTMAVELVKAQVGALLGAQGAKLAENLAGQAVEAAVLQRADLTQALQASTPLPPTR